MKMTNKDRVIISIVLFLFSIIVFGAIVTPAGISIVETGEEMSYIRSVGGNSVAEEYYQLHGEVYVGFGRIIVCIGIALCLGGSFVSGWILKPVITSNKSKIDTFADDVKDRVTRATQELSKSTVNATSVAHKGKLNNADSLYISAQNDTDVSKEYNENKCRKCGTILTEGSLFCTKCGSHITEHPVSPKVCPTCGNHISNEAMFCTKCGHKLG